MPLVMSRNAYFNSIKVQLKPFSDGFTPAQPLFQFHKGTIKTFLR